MILYTVAFNDTMMSYDNSSRRLNSTFEIISACIADRFYNHLYSKAKQLTVTKQYKTITDGYRIVCSKYMLSISENPKSYKELVDQIHQYYISSATRYSSITLGDMIDEIVKQFVPADLFAETLNKRGTILKNSLISAMQQFHSDMMRDHHIINTLIDNRSDDIMTSRNIRAMQDSLITALNYERTKIFDTVLKKSAPKSNKNYHEVTELKKKLVLLVKKNTMLTSINAGSSTRMATVKQKLNTVVKELRKSREQYDILVDKYKTIEQQLTLVHTSPVITPSIAYIAKSADAESSYTSMLREPSKSLKSSEPKEPKEPTEPKELSIYSNYKLTDHVHYPETIKTEHSYIPNVLEVPTIEPNPELIVDSATELDVKPIDINFGNTDIQNLFDDME